MAKRTFFVRAKREEEAGAFVAECDIIGLRIEAAPRDEFEDILKEVGPELIVVT